MTTNAKLPIVAANRPVGVDLEEGETYYFCACGRSSNQPFCDGSHKGTAYPPQAFVADETSKQYLCACKHTKNPPFCDGSHKQFSKDDIGKPGPGVTKQAGAPEPVASPEEPHVAFIHQLAREGLSKLGRWGFRGTAFQSGTPFKS